MARPSRIVKRTGALPGRSSPNPRNDESLISTLLNNIPVSFQTITEARTRTTPGSLRLRFSPSSISLFDPARKDTDYNVQGHMPLHG